MGFRFRWWFGLFSAVLLCSCIPARSDERSSYVTVLLNDSAHVAPAVLATAEDEVVRIFHTSGITIVWVNCSGSTISRCRVQPGANEFVLHIVKSGKTSTDSVFGEAFLAEDGTGKYADVFFERIQDEKLESNLAVGRLLGSVVAHELGHLLLGSRAHSRRGIMEPIWREDQLRRMNMGAMVFSPEEAKLIKARVGEQDGNVLITGRFSELHRSTASARPPRLQEFLP
jgi:hypothetical protein